MEGERRGIKAGHLRRLPLTLDRGQPPDQAPGGAFSFQDFTTLAKHLYAMLH